MQRLQALQHKMIEQNVDLVAIGPGMHLKWLLGITPHADERVLLVCVTQDNIAFLMPALEADSARQHTELAFYTWTDAQGPAGAFETLMTDLNIKSAKNIVLDEAMRADFAGLVQDALPQAKRQFCETTIGALRMQKSEDEYECLKSNALIADAAMQAGWASMKVGMTEKQVALVIREKFADLGAKPLFTIIGAGENGAFPHHQTGDAKLQIGDAVVMDIGASSERYPSDITRMAIIGEEPSGYSDVHLIVENAVEAALEAARPGAKAHEVDDAARGVIEAAGYGKYFVHRTGHGMGIEGHEPPYITSSSQTILQEGMVFSIEPGIYLPGRFGIRLEDIVILRADGPEILSSLPREAVLIGG
ncbi:MAG: M24 family metallopeptidase [Lentilitoribacter sp.]